MKDLILETERLIIKNTSVSDIDLIMKMDTQEITQKYLGGIKNKTEYERLEFLKNKKDLLTVYLKDNTPIGFCGLKTNNKEGYLSYIFDSDYINNGYCTEAVKSILDYVFNKMDIDVVNAECVSENISSIRVLEKLNFKYKGNHKKDKIEFLDYYLLKKDYNIETI